MNTATLDPKTSPLNQWAIHIAAAPVLLASFILPAPRDGSLAGIPSLCVFHNLTGLPCPGCGMTRSIVCCAHGLWTQAVWYHPLGPLFFALLLNLTLAPLFARLWPRLLAVAPSQIISRASSPALYALAALFLIIWAARLLGGLPSPP